MILVVPIPCVGHRCSIVKTMLMVLDMVFANECETQIGRELYVLPGGTVSKDKLAGSFQPVLTHFKDHSFKLRKTSRLL